jgi:hypothetical protein
MTYEGFLEDMGHAPEGKSLDRIDNDSAYTKANCRWADARVQARNSQKATYYEGKNAYEWAEQLGVSPQTICYRIRKWGSPYYPDHARNKLARPLGPTKALTLAGLSWPRLLT